MSLSEILIKLGGIVLFIVGLSLLLAVVGVNFLGVTFPFGGILGELVVGVLFIAAGIYLIRGGSIGL